MNHLVHLLGRASTLKTIALDLTNSNFLISKYFLYLFSSWQNLKASKNEELNRNC